MTVINKTVALPGINIDLNKKSAALATGNAFQTILGIKNNIFLNEARKVAIDSENTINMGHKVKINLGKTLNKSSGISFSKYNLDITHSEHALHYAKYCNRLAGGMYPDQWENSVLSRTRKFNNWHKEVIFQFLITLGPILRIIKIQPISDNMIDLVNKSIVHIIESISMVLLGLAQTRFAARELQNAAVLQPVGNILLNYQGVSMAVSSYPYKQKEDLLPFNILEYENYFCDTCGSLSEGAGANLFLQSNPDDKNPTATIVTHLKAESNIYSSIDISTSDILFLSNNGINHNTHHITDDLKNAENDFVNPKKYALLFLNTEEEPGIIAATGDINSGNCGSMTMDYKNTELYQIGSKPSFQIDIVNKKDTSLTGTSLFMDDKSFKLAVDDQYSISADNRSVSLVHKEYSFLKIDCVRKTIKLGKNDSIKLDNQNIDICKGVFKTNREARNGELKTLETLNHKLYREDILKRKEEIFEKLSKKLDIMKTHFCKTCCEENHDSIE